jgi:hypothetical protein
MIKIALDWKFISWMPSEKWKEIFLKVQAEGISEEQLARSVYVIRLNGYFCINYPGGQSPTVYVGEGNFRQRMSEHKKWARDLIELVGKSTFEICIATLSIKNNTGSHQDCEAALLQLFKEKYETAPLWNKQLEKRRFNHHEYNKNDMAAALGKRRGAKYRWSVVPMPASGFQKNFLKTHAASRK